MSAPPERLQAALEPLHGWLSARIPSATAVELTDFDEPTQGMSNRTVCFTATWLEHGERREQEMVARIQREGNPPFIADVFKQWRVMEAIAASPEVPVPPLLWAEPDPSVIGAPFFLMARVEGRVPPDRPGYHAAGWLVDELDPSERSRLWWNGIEAMSRLHEIDWRRFAFLSGDVVGVPDAAYYVRHFCGAWYEWAAQGREYPIVDAALRHLIDHAPATTQAGLVWNDARLGNTIFAPDLRVGALIDFEAADVGPAEVDVAWWLFAEELFSTGFGFDRLDGIPDRATAIAGIERIYGRSIDFEYYEAVAALKLAVISIRLWHNANADEWEVQSDERNAPLEYATDCLARYLGTAVPPGS
jgi:aminoglycoside phosphotransferase (APT) family kinase protein